MQMRDKEWSVFNMLRSPLSRWFSATNQFGLRQRQILIVLLLAFVVFLLVDRVPLDAELQLSVLIGLVVGLGLNINGRYHLSSIAVIITLFIAPYVSIIRLTELESARIVSTLIWLTVPLVISTVLCEMTEVLVISVGNFLFMLSLPLWVERFTYGVMAGSLEYIGILSAILIFTAYQRSLIEQDRRRVIEESERRLHLALDSAKMSTWHWMVEGDRLIWSNQGHQIWGKHGQPPPSSFQDYLRVLHPDDVPRINAAVEALLQAAEEEWFEARHRVKRPDGQWAWLELKGHVQLKGAKQPLALVGTISDVTGRMKTALALSESEHRFKLLAENLPGLVYLVKYDEQFTPLYLSDSIETLTGIPKRRFLDGEITIGDLCDPDDRARVRWEIGRAVKQESSYHLLYRLQNTAGEWRWIEEFGVAIHEKDEILLEGFLHDITERRRDEMMLAQQAAEMTALYETSVALNSTRDLKELLDTIIERAAVLLGMEMGLLSLVSADGQLVEFVAGYNRVIPYSSSRIQVPVGQGIAGVIAETGRPLIIENYETWEGRLNLPNPTPIGRTLGMPLKYNDEVIGAISVFDQEPGRFTPDEIRTLSLFATYAAVSIQNSRFFEQEQRQRETSDILRNVGLVVHSSLDLKEVFNRILSELDKVVPYDGAHIMLIESPENVRMVASRRVYQDLNLLGELIPIKAIPLARKVLQDQQPWLIPDTLQEPRFIGSYRSSEPVRSLILLPLVDHGESIGVLTVLSYVPHTYTADDLNVAFQFSQQVVMAIVNARLLEQERDYSAELETRVAERTKELAQAKDAAESASRAKSAFLAHMSHELRTPLTAIMGFTQILMLSDSLTAEEQENLGIVNQSSQHLLTVINDVLDMSKIESGKVTLSAHDFDLGQMLQKLEDMFSLRATRKNLHFVIKKNFEMSQFIHADEQKLLQVLINLLSNAFKFTEVGQVELTIIAHVKAAEKLCLRFEVADTGPGIPAAQLEKLFQPFMQISSVSRSKSGTGLGLAISQQFVQLMGGQLNVQSVEGEGAVFSFVIEVPLLDGAASPKIMNRSASGLAANQPTYRILVIDRPREADHFLRSLLNPLGFAVRTAASEEEALQVIEAWFPHVIFLALNHSQKQDLATLAEIKLLAANQKAILIPFTEQLTEIGELETIVADCETILVKPFTAQRIFDTLQRYLGVQFVYTNGLEDVTITDETSLFTPIDVQQLPLNWLEKMHQAAVKSDQSQMLQLIAQIEDDAPSAAAYFKQLVTTFNTRTILKLTNPQSFDQF